MNATAKGAKLWERGNFTGSLTYNWLAHVDMLAGVAEWLICKAVDWMAGKPSLAISNVIALRSRDGRANAICLSIACQAARVQQCLLWNTNWLPGHWQTKMQDSKTSTPMIRRPILPLA